MTVKSIKDAPKRRATGAAGLLCTDKGTPKKCLANVLHVLSTHPQWEGVIAYDEFRESVVKLRPPPVREYDGASLPGEWTEGDSTRTAAWFATFIGFEPAVTQVDQAVVAIAERSRMHPVRAYLADLEWDGTERLPRMFVVYFGATDTEYTRAIGQRWMVSAVARVMRPGCQADCMPVLEGPQGLGKSTGVACLFSVQWFADTGISVGDKDSYQALRGKWGYEFGELSSIKGREIERVKAFVSARTDTYRPSFGRRTRDFPRQVVFCGSTNDDSYLVDRTGNRRYWPVRCSRIDVAAIERDRDQLWAEARVRFERGEPWHVDTPELRKLCEAAQQEREIEDPWLGMVRDWLTAPIRASVVAAEGVTTAEVMTSALGIKAGEMRHDLVTRTGHILRALGWTPRQQRENGARIRRYFAAAQAAQAGEPDRCDDEAASTLPDSSLSHLSHPHIYTHIRTGIGTYTDQLTTLGRDGCDTGGAVTGAAGAASQPRPPGTESPATVDGVRHG